MASLIRILKQRGYKVAAVKHASHGYTMDSPGTDSWHYAQSGADQVVVAGPESITFHEMAQIIALQDILARIENVDIILVEGFKNQPGPKIEIYRRGISADRVPANGDLLAVVSDIPIDGGNPVFSFDQLSEVAALITDRVM
jgi:molybdopterin-guanine dinucleotide biosynthesis protein MobB